MERVKELESLLKQVTKERDELQRDVEALCLQGDGYLSFSSSSVLSERITIAEKQLSVTQAKVRHDHVFTAVSQVWPQGVT